MFAENRATAIMTDRINRLSENDAATLTESLRQLDLDQFDFVCDVLEREVIDGRMSRQEFRRFEQFFDRWWAHPLPLKLTFLDHVASLARTHKRPFDVFPDLTKFGIRRQTEQDATRSADVGVLC